MKGKAIVVAAALVVLGGATTLFSQDDRKIYGAGTTSCARWTESRKGTTNEWTVAGQWVLGFVSAVNQYSKTSPAQVDARSMAVKIDEDRQTYPEDDVSDATRALVEFLLSESQP